MTDELTNFPTRWKTLLFLGLSGCASGPPTVPYPAFIVVDELPDAFVAGLPGVRAKQLTGDSHTGRSGSRIQIPADWEFSTGASPGLSVEIFVLAGELHLGEFSLTAGGYAYVPPGSTGLPMRSESGATVLYFLDPANERAVIQTLLWQPAMQIRLRRLAIVRRLTLALPWVAFPGVAKRLTQKYGFLTARSPGEHDIPENLLARQL